MMKRSMVLVVWSLFLFIFYPSARANELNYPVPPDDPVTQPVEVGFRMVVCGSSLFRCARITMKMNPATYDLLGQPEAMMWNYMAVGVSLDCHPFVGFLSCHRNNMSVSSSVKIVYDASRDEYSSLQTGQPFRAGVGFMLTSICLNDETDYNCEKVYLIGNSSKEDYVFKAVNFNAPDN